MSYGFPSRRNHNKNRRKRANRQWRDERGRFTTPSKELTRWWGVPITIAIAVLVGVLSG